VILLFIVKFLHVLCATTWLAAALWTPGDVRRTLALGRPHTDALARRARPTLALDLWAGVATVLTGIGAVGLEGGVPRAGIIVGLVAALARLALVAFALLPSAKVLFRVLEVGDLSGASAPAKRLGMLAGIGHLLWVVALAGMISS
jgi:hypothetical protein